MSSVLEKLKPFLALGIVIACLLGGVIIITYVLTWGLLIGGILFLGYTIKQKFFPSKVRHSTHTEKGRIIEHED